MSDAEAAGMMYTMAEINYWLINKAKLTDEQAADLTVKLYKKGIKMSDLSKKEYKDLPLDWIINLVS